MAPTFPGSAHRVQSLAVVQPQSERTAEMIRGAVPPFVNMKEYLTESPGDARWKSKTGEPNSILAEERLRRWLVLDSAASPREAIKTRIKALSQSTSIGSVEQVRQRPDSRLCATPQ